MITAAIFDMDGVMVNTEHIQSKAFEDVLAEYDIVAEKTEHGTVHVAGMTTPETWELLKEKHGLSADTSELTRKKRDAVISAIHAGIEPMRGLLDLLDDLHKHTIQLAVATSAQPERAKLVLGKLGILSYFKIIVTANDVENGKPAPDPYLKAAELLGTPPSECVVIEDAEVGVESAKAAKMKVIAVPNQYTQKMDFSKADLLVSSLENLDYNMVINI